MDDSFCGTARDQSLEARLPHLDGAVGGMSGRGGQRHGTVTTLRDQVFVGQGVSGVVRSAVPNAADPQPRFLWATAPPTAVNASVAAASAAFPSSAIRATRVRRSSRSEMFRAPSCRAPKR